MRKYLNTIERLREGNHITVGKIDDKWLIDKVIFDGYLENGGGIDEVLGALQHKPINTLSEVSNNKDKYIEDYTIYVNTIRLKETKNRQERLRAYVLENFETIFIGGNEEKRINFKKRLSNFQIGCWNDIDYLANNYICNVYGFNYLTNHFIFHADKIHKELKVSVNKSASLALIHIIDYYMADQATWIEKVKKDN